jgi:hypothetical protein
MDEKANDSPTDHHPRSGEGPVTDWFLLGLLCHGLQFVEQDLGVKLAEILVQSLLMAVVTISFSGCWVQGPGPVEPFGVDLNLLAVIGHDDVVHGPDVTAWIDLDCLA